MAATQRWIGSVLVRGVDVDEATRCAHWHGPHDVVAFRSPCCDAYHPCYRCHDAVEDHPLVPIPRAEHRKPGVLCGGCGALLTVVAYLATEDACPRCGHGFNPGCREHHPRYLELPGGG